MALATTMRTHRPQDSATAAAETDTKYFYVFSQLVGQMQACIVHSMQRKRCNPIDCSILSLLFDWTRKNDCKSTLSMRIRCM